MRQVLASTLAVSALLLAGSTAHAAPPLLPGDIAIIGVYADAPDTVIMVALRDIGSGIGLMLTDNGWKSDDTFRDTEGTQMFTTAGYFAGEVFAIEMAGLDSPSLSGDGDQIFLYHGDVEGSTPTGHFVAGATFAGATWTSTSTDSNTSALPDELIGFNSVLPDKDNAAYSADTTISVEDLLAALQLDTSYTGSNSDMPAYPASFDFSALSSDGGVGPDASSGSDGGFGDDAGFGAEAGVDASVDASRDAGPEASVDASVDLSVAPDASDDVDGGTTEEGDAAISEEDAGEEALDGEVTPLVDGSTPPPADAATSTPDGGVRRDSGVTGTSDGGGGCSTTGTRDAGLPMLLTMLAGAAILRRRQR